MVNGIGSAQAQRVPKEDITEAYGPAPPVWMTFSPRFAGNASRSRIAVSATNDRNSRKLCGWLAELGFEAHLCSDHDLLLEEFFPTMRGWSLMIIDADSVGGPGATSVRLSYLRETIPNLPVILLGNRGETARLIELVDNSVPVLTKPFMRKAITRAINRVLAGR